MSRRRRSAVLVLLTTVLLSLTTIDSARGLVASGHPPRPGGERAGSSLPDHEFVGVDGLIYSRSPEVLGGLDGQLYYGGEFDMACKDGLRIEHALDRFAKLARIIQDSGRKAIFTLGVPKTAVIPQDIDPTTLPHGDCDAVGLAQQRQLFIDYGDPNYLSLLRPLVASKREDYYATDLHWSSVGGSIFAKQLAARLSPQLGREQHYTYGTETRVMLLNSILNLNLPETAPTAFPRTKVRVTTAPTSKTRWTGFPALTADYSWNSRGGLTWPGNTLLLGDSFTIDALQNLRPIFRHGRVMWFVHSSLEDMQDAIKHADTVVIEVYEPAMLQKVITSKSFLGELRRKLR